MTWQFFRSIWPARCLKAELRFEGRFLPILIEFFKLPIIDNYGWVCYWVNSCELVLIPNSIWPEVFCNLAGVWSNHCFTHIKFDCDFFSRVINRNIWQIDTKLHLGLNRFNSFITELPLSFAKLKISFQFNSALRTPFDSHLHIKPIFSAVGENIWTVAGSLTTQHTLY